MVHSDNWITKQIKDNEIISPAGEYKASGLSSGTEGYGYDLRLGRSFQRMVGSQLLDPKNMDGVTIKKTFVADPSKKLIEPKVFQEWLVSQQEEDKEINLSEEQKEEIAFFQEKVKEQQQFFSRLFKEGKIDVPKDVLYQNHFDILPGHSVLAESYETLKIPRDTLVIIEGKSTFARLGLIVNTTPFDPEWKGKATLCLVNPTNHTIRIYPEEGIAKVLYLEASEPCTMSYADKKGKYQNASGAQTAKVIKEDGDTVGM